MAWSERAKEDFKEREEYHEEHDESLQPDSPEEKKTEVGEKPAEPTAPMPDSWDDKMFSQTVSRIRNGDWNDASAAIIALRDEVRRMQTDRKEYDSRLQKLMDENAMLLTQITGSADLSEHDSTGNETDHKTSVMEDIDALWIV